jgi:hypothetical protein
MQFIFEAKADSSKWHCRARRACLEIFKNLMPFIIQYKKLAFFTHVISIDGSPLSLSPI